MLTKLHSLYEEDTLRAHCLLSQARQIVGLSASERLKARVRARQSRLLAKKPEKQSGFVEFKKSPAAGRLLDDPARSADDDLAGLARHRADTRILGAAWRALPMDRRAAMTSLARARAKEAKERIEEAVREIGDSIDLIDRRDDQSRRDSGFTFQVLHPSLREVGDLAVV